MSIMIIPDYAKSASTKTKNYTGAKAKLSKLEYKNGGYIVDLKNRTKATSVPTLVISLGGLGGKTLNKIKERYIKSINDENQTISFLAIDTSENDLSAIRRSMSEYGYLDDNEYAMVASHLDPALIDIVLNTKNNPRCPQYSWMDKNIPDSTKIDTNGAQCRRQIGRLMLSHSTNYDNLLNKIRSKIHDLSQQSAVVQGSRPLNVILVAGISGGTGSGTIVDISYMVRLALVMEGGLKPQFDAILYTPDVQFGTPAKKEALQRNFVAAMKEIDAFMEALNAKEKYSFPCEKFPDGKVMVPPLVTPIGDNCEIFDSCTLVQAYDAAGGSLSCETVMDNVTNYVASLISNSTVVDPNEKIPVQLSRAILNNKPQFVREANDLKRSNPQLPRDVYYCYNAMGYSAVKFPVEEIVTIMANRTSIALIELYDKAPVQAASAVLSTAGLIPAEADESSDNLYDALFEKGANVSASQRIVSLSRDLTFNDVKGDDVRPAMNNLKIQNIKFETDWITNVYDNVVSALKEEMKANGPFAAKRLSQRICDFLGSMINRSAEICQAYENNCKDYENKASSFKKEAQNMGKINQLFGGNKKEEITTGFINALKTRDLYYWKNRCMESGDVRNALTELMDKFHTLDTEMYERYVGAFTAIAEILQNDSAQQLNASVTTDAAGKSFSANMLNIAEMNDENSRLSQIVKYYLTPERIAEMSNSIIRDMMDNVSDWTGTNINEFNAVENTKKLFKNQFKAFLDSTIEKFLVVKYTEGKATVEDVCEAIDKIINNGEPSVSEDARWAAFEQHCETQYGINPLQKAAEEIFKQAIKVGLCATPESAGGMTGVAFPRGFNAFYNYKILCLMESTPHINEKIKNLSEFDTLKLDSSFVCGESKGSEVTYLNVVSCLPLYYFKGMLSHQEVYAKSLASGSDVDAGMHMDCGEEAPWKEFSPLCTNLTIEAVNGRAQALTRSDYQAEEKILANIKMMADFCESPEMGFIVSGTDNAVLSYIDKDLYINNEIGQWENKLLDSYRKKVEEAASGIEVPGSIADAESFWENAFAEKYNNSLPGMKTLMKENGYIFAERGIQAAAISMLPVCGETSHGAYDDIQNAESGSFYKNIRRSTETRRRLKSIYDMATELKEKMDAVKKEVTEAAKNNALESFRSGKNAMLIDIMIQAVLSGYISLDYDKDSMALTAVMVDSLSDGASSKSEIFRYAGKKATESKYILFGAFAAWFLNINKDDEEWWNVYRENVTDTFSKNIAVIKAENRKEKILALMPEKSDEIKYESVLTRATVYQKINSAFESEKMMSSAYSVPIDTTMLSAAKDDVSIASQLEYFYNKVEGIISAL